jgi:hypothetical protein
VQVILSSVSSLLHCVDIAGTSRLYLAASVECYQPWQRALFAVIVLVGIVPPALAFISWHVGAERPGVDASPLSRAWDDAALATYRPAVRYWHSVLLSELLALTALGAFCTDAVARAVLQFMVCFGATVLHVYALPFKSPRLNRLASLTLVCWCLLSAMFISDAAALVVARPAPLDTSAFAPWIALLPLPLFVATYVVPWVRRNWAVLRAKRNGLHQQGSLQ